MKPSQKNKPLKDTLLERIESEDVRPRSKLFFRSRECLVWTLWLLSIVVGALAVAVSLFVVSHSQYALYEATHENLFTYLVEVLPFLWMVTFGLMVYVGIYNLRHTKQGYKYPMWFILASSVVLSFAGGSALQMFGLGHSIDYVLGDNMGVYMSQEKMEQKMWQNPEAGRLVGKQVFSTLSPTSTIVFEDMVGQRWILSIQDLPATDITMLASGKNVRIIGEAMNQEFMIFHACGTFSWMPDKIMTSKEMHKEKREFLERMYVYREESKQSNAAERHKDEEICSNIPLYLGTKYK
jgi:hypothetical protein